MPSSFLPRSRRVECGMVARGPRLATARYALTWSRLALGEDKSGSPCSVMPHSAASGPGQAPNVGG